MFKKILPLFLLLCLSSGLLAQSTDYSRWNLNGRVKMVVEQVYELPNNANGVDTLAYTYYNTFDQFGNKVLDIRMKSDGRVDENYVYTYNEDHQRDKSYQYDFDGKLIRTIYYLYNSKGVLYADSSMMADGQIDKIFRYFYDGDGKLSSDESYGGDGMRRKKYQYSYDSLGRKTEIKRMNRDLELERRSILTYDKNDNVVHEATYWPDGSLKYQETCHYVYDEKNNWVEKTIIWDGRTVKKITRDITYYQ